MHTRTRALGVSINRTYRGLAAVDLQAGIHLYVVEPQQRYLNSTAGPLVSDAFEYVRVRETQWRRYRLWQGIVIGNGISQFCYYLLLLLLLLAVNTNEWVVAAVAA